MEPPAPSLCRGGLRGAPRIRATGAECGDGDRGCEGMRRGAGSVLQSRLMEVQIAVAKVGKWASRESGDTLEMVERPGGGVSLVLVDGQDSGQGARAISNVVARKAISLLAEGVRDG